MPRIGVCADRATITLDVHAFARARDEAGQVVETAEDYASRIGEAIELTLADQWIDMPEGTRAKLSLSDIRLLQDEEPDAFHYVAQITAKVLSPRI